jgi:RsiW-degrading membrane proteinase PrsW (M82 family)
MSHTFLLEAPIGLVPVAVFLAALMSFDSYKLVSIFETSMALTAGVLLCGAAYLMNAQLIALADVDVMSFSRTIAPVVEETAKAAMIMALFWRNRIGFMIDAAIMGFAVGTGFAVVENLYYLYVFADANIGTWIVRGFGTAIMHGGSTALFAIVSQQLIERAPKFNPVLYLPGLAAAIGLHLVYNLLSAAPLFGAVAMLVLLPTALFFVFTKSEHTVHSWLVQDYETHEKVLSDIQSGAFRNSEAGRFIAAMAKKLGANVAADMFAYIRVHTELALRADQVDLAREKGGIPITDGDREKFRRLHELEGRIGRTAMLALWPHLHFTRKQLWELNEFEREVREA